MILEDLPQYEADMSERVTWTTCPLCSEAAAVGWLQEEPIEFDCRTGCLLPDLGILDRQAATGLMNSAPDIPLAR